MVHRRHVRRVWGGDQPSRHDGFGYVPTSFGTSSPPFAQRRRGWDMNCCRYASAFGLGAFSSILAVQFIAPSWAQDLPPRDAKAEALPPLVVERPQRTRNVRRATVPRRGARTARIVNPVVQPAQTSQQAAPSVRSAASTLEPPKAASEMTFTGEDIAARP
jgi:hypothetical protein